MSEITHGIMEMPYELAMQSELSRRQFWNCAREIWQKSQAATPPAAQVQGEKPEVVGQLALDEPFNGTEGLEIGDWEFVPERAVVESMLAESTGEMVPLMTVAQHERIVAALSADNQRLVPPEPILAKSHPMAEAQGEREGFDCWFRREEDLPDSADTTYISAAYLPWKAWCARAALSAPPAAAGVPALRVQLRKYGEADWQVHWVPTDDGLRGHFSSPLYWRNFKLGDEVVLYTAPTPPASEQQQAVVLPELTNVRCVCGDEYPHDSYGAGFIAGSGMCENCDAAIPPKDPSIVLGLQEMLLPIFEVLDRTIDRLEHGHEHDKAIRELRALSRLNPHLAGVNQGVTTEAGNGGEV